ncbi:MAG: GYD domain-containing protein [Candidatus Aminicenantaceae bacterium]
MPKYLFHGSYTEEGLKGLLKEGGSKRREATEQLVKSIGGTLEVYYFAFGDNDFYLIVDAPDNVSATAGSLVANASGAVKVKTVVLLTPEEVDQAVKNTVEYRPPGQ